MRTNHQDIASAWCSALLLGALPSLTKWTADHMAEEQTFFKLFSSRCSRTCSVFRCCC